MSLHTWLSSSLVRHYPATPARRNATLRLDAARNERLSAQVALRWEPDGRRWPGWAYGDGFMVYPGPDGPIDSLRWEVFGDSLQDYALLQTLDTDRDSALLQPLRSFQDFPKSEAWIRSARRRLLGWRSSRKV
jgi:hypothetical protein